MSTIRSGRNGDSRKGLPRDRTTTKASVYTSVRDGLTIIYTRTRYRRLGSRREGSITDSTPGERTTSRFLSSSILLTLIGTTSGRSSTITTSRLGLLIATGYRSPSYRSSIIARVTTASYRPIASNPTDDSVSSPGGPGRRSIEAPSLRASAKVRTMCST